MMRFLVCKYRFHKLAGMHHRMVHKMVLCKRVENMMSTMVETVDCRVLGRLMHRILVVCIRPSHQFLLQLKTIFELKAQQKQKKIDLQFILLMSKLKSGIKLAMKSGKSGSGKSGNSSTL